MTSPLDRDGWPLPYSAGPRHFRMRQVYHFTTVVFDLETALLRPARVSRRPTLRPGAAEAWRRAAADGLGLAAYTRSDAHTARSRLAQALGPKGPPPEFVLTAPLPGSRRNPFTAAAH